MVGWFGLVYEEDLKRPLVPLKEAKATLDLYLETILVWVGSGRSGPIVILRLTQSSWAGAGTELGNIDLPQQSKTSCRTSLPTPCLVEWKYITFTKHKGPLRTSPIWFVTKTNIYAYINTTKTLPGNIVIKYVRETKNMNLSESFLLIRIYILNYYTCLNLVVWI